MLKLSRGVQFSNSSRFFIGLIWVSPKFSQNKSLSNLAFLMKSWKTLISTSQFKT